MTPEVLVTISSRRRLLVAASAAVIAMVGMATPASASQVDYGYVQATSSCPTSSSTAPCYVYLKYPAGSSTTKTTRPLPIGGVLCPGNVADGMPIKSAINGDYLNGKYVAVIWGSDVSGQINCH